MAAVAYSGGSRGSKRVQGLIVGLAAAVAFAAPSSGEARPFPLSDTGLLISTTPLEVAAAFRKRSYAPGDVAAMVVRVRARRLTVQLFRCGPEETLWRGANTLRGVRMGAPRTILWIRFSGSAHTVYVRPGRDWPSGFYFARLSTRDGRIGFAPFVLRAAVSGRTARVAAFLPTNTWQAYNLRDVTGDGIGDSWYADPSVRSVLLTRPYLHRGVPPFFRRYDYGFIRWVARREKPVDFFSDDDFARFKTAATLRRRYDLIVFPGHEEYVTKHEYDLIVSYRNAGGNVAFLSANNFYYRVTREGDRIYKSGRWRDLGRPEAALVGVQYLNWFQNRYPNAPYVVQGATRTPWLFRGTGLVNGSRFGAYGIEIDARTSRSPVGTRLLANVPDVFGPGQTAEMTYYTTGRSAKVFAAGTLNFGGSAAGSPLVRKLLDNIWARLGSA